MTPESRDRVVKMLELLVTNLRAATAEQLENLTVRVEQKRKIPKHKRPLWIEQKALQVFRTEKAAGKTNEQATKAANKALAHLRLDVKIRDGNISIEDTGPPVFTTRALVAVDDRDRHGARRKAGKRLKPTPR
jgi:hypothetical protein